MSLELKVAIQAARQAGTFLLEHYGAPMYVSYKGEIDPVTEMDHEAERIISATLSEAYPQYAILGEEDHHSAPGDLPRWIVDPLDGTTNYAHGYPLFAVSIGLEHRGQISLGVVYNPLLDELYTAEPGKGAWLNGQRLKVSSVGTLGEALLASGFPYDVWASGRDNLAQWSYMVKHVLSPRCDGCASLDLCHVAAGKLDGYWELDLESWDMAAGVCIVREAGGVVTQVSGEAFQLETRNVLAANPDLHAVLVEALQPGSR